MLHLEDLDYDLPPALIAQEPLADREASRLLVLGAGGEVGHRRVRELPGLLPRCLIVLNDTRVIPARLLGRKASGGKAELLLVERLDGEGERERWACLGKSSKGFARGTRIVFGDGELGAEVVENARAGGGLVVELRATGGVGAAVERLGHVPLPPYIRRSDDAADRERYQTVFAARDGAVAAPTAGLHFGHALIEGLRAAGHELAFVTLHVGPGTFAPLRAPTLEQHAMHAERYAIAPGSAAAINAARAAGRPVLAVGTTVVRALESAALESGGALCAYAASTSLFIKPPFEFRVVDALMTNFHLPRSTLLALVMAFGGVEPVRTAYRAAVGAGYRFYSYGDAMLIPQRWRP